MHCLPESRGTTNATSSAFAISATSCQTAEGQLILAPHACCRWRCMPNNRGIPDNPPTHLLPLPLQPVCCVGNLLAHGGGGGCLTVGARQHGHPRKALRQVCQLCRASTSKFRSAKFASTCIKRATCNCHVAAAAAWQVVQGSYGNAHLPCAPPKRAALGQQPASAGSSAGQAGANGVAGRFGGWLCMCRAYSGFCMCRARQAAIPAALHSTEPGQQSDLQGRGRHYLNSKPLLCRTGQPPWAAACSQRRALTCNDLVHGWQEVP